MNQEKCLKTLDPALHRSGPGIATQNSMDGVGVPSVFNYLDYREFVRDRFDSLRKITPELSHRKFVRKAGFSSPSVLNGIMTKRRGLSPEGAAGIALALELNEIETEFFINLVRLSVAKLESDRMMIRSRLADAQIRPPESLSTAADLLHRSQS